MANENTLQTVIAAKISAELYHAQQITRSLSISSKNLRTLAKRIGHAAAGLAVLASFYDEYSRESIKLADQVSEMTIDTANRAVREWRTVLYENALLRVCSRLPPERIPQIVRSQLDNKPFREKENKNRIDKFNRELSLLLIDMQKNIRSIAVIAVNSKIEAPKTAEHAQVLLDMADNVEVMIAKILNHIDVALKYIQQ